MEDRLRFFAEECESLQGLHMLVDVDSVCIRLCHCVCVHDLMVTRVDGRAGQALHRSCCRRSRTTTPLYELFVCMSIEAVCRSLHSATRRACLPTAHKRTLRQLTARAVAQSTHRLPWPTLRRCRRCTYRCPHSTSRPKRSPACDSMCVACVVMAVMMSLLLVR